MRPIRGQSGRFGSGNLGTPGRGPARTPIAIRARQTVNWINLATPLGLAVALACGARIGRGPHGLLVATGYRWSVPPMRGRAITIGDVVLLGLDDEALARHPKLMEHEARHSGQYARWLGPAGFLPAYGLASLWSWWTTGDPALHNRFESKAGLVDGGYASN
jgi:hypothetical protein